MKRLVSRASLQKPSSEQILDHQAMFNFCVSDIPNIDFLFINKNELVTKREMLTNRFEKTYAVPGTRSFHMFQPLSSSCISVKIVVLTKILFNS